MKKLLLLLIALLSQTSIFAQQCDVDSVFHAYIYNDDYKVYLDLNLYDQTISVPGQSIFGELPGYLGAVRDSRKWLITSAEIDKETTKVRLEIVNDYGSEDLTATLSYNPSTKVYTFKQIDGSRIKIVVNRKWVKLPTELNFVKHERVADDWY